MKSLTAQSHPWPCAFQPVENLDNVGVTAGYCTPLEPQFCTQTISDILGIYEDGNPLKGEEFALLNITPLRSVFCFSWCISWWNFSFNSDKSSFMFPQGTIPLQSSAWLQLCSSRRAQAHRWMHSLSFKMKYCFSLPFLSSFTTLIPLESENDLFRVQHPNA